MAERAPKPDPLTPAAWPAMIWPLGVNGVVQATIDTLIAEKPGGHDHSRAAAKPDTAARHLSFPDENQVSLLLSTAAVAVVAHVLMSALSDA